MTFSLGVSASEPTNQGLNLLKPWTKLVSPPLTCGYWVLFLSKRKMSWSTFFSLHYILLFLLSFLPQTHTVVEFSGNGNEYGKLGLLDYNRAPTHTIQLFSQGNREKSWHPQKYFLSSKDHDFGIYFIFKINFFCTHWNHHVLLLLC